MDRRLIDNITVLGGGTAGWLTAIYAKHQFPKKQVSLIESEEFGILGAGEGATPHLVEMLRFLGIDVKYFLKEADSTIKAGIKFTNWNNGGPSDSYFHPFSTTGEMNPYASNLNGLAYPHHGWLTDAIVNKVHLDNVDLSASFCKVNKVPFAEEDGAVRSLSNYSLHFDATKLAAFLRRVAESADVHRIEGKVVSFTQDEYNDVKVLELESGELVNTDFVFDASGFRRFFPKAFETEWVSHAKALPVNSAMPFFLDMGDEIPPYTEAIAMKYGWIWKIPLQSRYGCGYVYDSNLVTLEDVKSELEEMFPEARYPRETPLTFEAGYLAEPWKHNVVSVGLSSGFIEPLEATSIMSTANFLADVLSKPYSMYSRDPWYADDVNRRFRDSSEDIARFVYFHYMSGRTDTEFWKHFTVENAPESLQQWLSTLKYRPPYMEEEARSIWSTDSWTYVGVGIQYKDMIESYLNAHFRSPHQHVMGLNSKILRDMQANALSNLGIPHREFIERAIESVSKDPQ